MSKQISTIAELLALPVRSVVQLSESTGGVFLKIDHDTWFYTGSHEAWTSVEVARVIAEPAVVLA